MFFIYCFGLYVLFDKDYVYGDEEDIVYVFFEWWDVYGFGCEIGVEYVDFGKLCEVVE